MSSRAEILDTLQEIRNQLRSLSPSYDTEFQEFALADTVRDWDYAAEPVFTSTELLEFETIYQRLRLRWVERSNALKERMMTQMVQEYLQVLRKAERRHRRLQQEEADMNDEPMENDVPEDDAFESPKAVETPMEDETPEDAWDPDAVPSQQPTRAEPDPVPESSQSAVQTPQPTPETTESTDGPGNANRPGRNRSNRP